MTDKKSFIVVKVLQHLEKEAMTSCLPHSCITGRIFIMTVKGGGPNVGPASSLEP